MAAEAAAPPDAAPPAAAEDGASKGKKVQISSEVREMEGDEEWEPHLTTVGQYNAGTRLYSQGRERSEERRKILAMMKEEQSKGDLTECRFVPGVIKKEDRYKDFQEFLANVKKQEKDRMMKLQKKIKEREKERPEFRGLDQPWTVSKTSQDIIEKKLERGQYQGPVKGWKRRFAKYLRSRDSSELESQGAGDPNALFCGTPTINQVSRTLPRDGAAHERLHELAHERQETLELLRAWEQEKDRLDPDTGRPRFQPRVLASPRAVIHYENARLRTAGHSPYTSPARSAVSGASGFARRRSFGELYQHLNSRRRIGGPTRAVQCDYAECTFVPQTNPTSTLIVERAGRRPPLYQPPQTEGGSASAQRSRRSTSREPRDGGAHPGSGSALSPPTDHSLAGRGGPPVRPGRHGYSDANDANNNFLARQCREVLEKQRRVQQLREQLVARELAGCTFMPQLSQRSHELFESSSYKKLGRPERGEGRRSFQAWEPAVASPGDSECAPREVSREPPAPAARAQPAAAASPDPAPGEPPSRRDSAPAAAPPRRSPQPPNPLPSAGSHERRRAPSGSGPSPGPSSRAAGASRSPATARTPAQEVFGPRAAGESPFLTSLQSELHATLDEWRNFKFD
eukprot:TRINITY_DN28138_c0_g1_i1.p1 TRINITY_DN28138_c0_g1~~TRINITY_DN28138_c0_g1_i1.p1  ORF type:complete len:655 (+),score=175.66 TRINITY_DN28138_c0_g1_i1:83-1966(+)